MILAALPHLHGGGTETTMRTTLAQVILREHTKPQISGILSHLYVQKHQLKAHHSSPQIISAWVSGCGLLQDPVPDDLTADSCGCTQNTSQNTRGGRCSKPDFTEREETQRSNLTEDNQERLQNYGSSTQVTTS